LPCAAAAAYVAPSDLPASPMEPPPVAFRTRVDRWLAVILALALLGGLWSVVSTFRMDPAAGWVVAAVLAGSVLFVAALSLPTEYVVTEHELVVRFGLFRQRIPLAAIEEVYPTRNPLSAPAWSLDRLAVRYRTGQRRGLALISPARQDAFLSLLGERAGLRREGAELRRVVPAS